jgi:hypothetical protein
VSEDFFDQADADLEAAQEADKAWDDATEWQPDKKKKQPATLRGTMLDVKWISTKYGFSYLMLVRDFEDEDLYWKVWGSRSVIKSELETAAPARNSKVVIQWLGTQKGKNDDSVEYHVYKVTTR